MKITDKTVAKKIDIFKKNYLIKSNAKNTILVSKKDSGKKFIVEGPSKIIIDNLSKPKSEVILLLQKKYSVDKELLERDYFEFLEWIFDLDNSNVKAIDLEGKKFNAFLGSSVINTCTVEITNRCSFFCDHCYVESNGTNNMGIDLFKKIIDELKKINCFQILLTGGEPLLHQDFFEMYEHAKNNGFLVSINSNGFLINEQHLKMFNKFKPEVIEISLYGYNDETYKEFTHVDNSYTKVNNNIDKLLDIGIKVNLKSVATKKNVKYIKKLKEYADSKGLPFRYDYIIFPKIKNKKSEKNSQMLNPKEIINLLKEDQESISYFEKAVSVTNEIKKYDNSIKKIFQCTLGKDRIFIDSHGNIKACLVINKEYNIRDYSILEVLNNIEKEICSLEFTTNSKCINCYKRNICRYCPGRFYLETQSYELPPSYYCELADLLIEEFEQKKVVFEHYNYYNKIPIFKAKEMLKILIPFYNELNGKDNSDKEMCDSWIEMIRGTKDFAVILLYFDKLLVGFINYMYQKEGLMISEIQIRKEYQGKYRILRKLLGEMINNSNKNRYTNLLATINHKNKKSIDIFTHIGFKNIKDNLYKINILELEKWLNK